MKEIDYKKLSYYNTTVPIYKTQNEIRTILDKLKIGYSDLKFLEE